MLVDRQAAENIKCHLDGGANIDIDDGGARSILHQQAAEVIIVYLP